MRLTLKIAKILVRLIKREVIASSTAKSKLITELVEEKILWEKGKHQKTLQLLNEEQLSLYLSNQLQISNLDNYIRAIEKEGTSRADFVKVAGNSKLSKERVFKGFLVNSYQPIKAKLNGESILIQPKNGTFTFIYDFETFIVDKDITIVGVENSSNFRYIEKQKYLFKTIKPLFISRYPQNQNKDFIKWMKSIPNNYLHFGDFDFAGIGIYLNEYKRHLVNKAKFFIPNNIEKGINKGDRERFNVQKINFNIDSIEEKELLHLIKIINKYKKGLDQEYYI